MFTFLFVENLVYGNASGFRYFSQNSYKQFKFFKIKLDFLRLFLHSIVKICPVRLVGQDIGFSSRQQEFESPTGCQC